MHSLTARGYLDGAFASAYTSLRWPGHAGEARVASFVGTAESAP
jgi:hypothetical protein